MIFFTSSFTKISIFLLIGISSIFSQTIEPVSASTGKTVNFPDYPIHPHQSQSVLSEFNSSLLSREEPGEQNFTPVDRLTDVEPTDWAFQALQSLGERYGCATGYPDGSFRGNRSLNRYEFAAALSACLQTVNQIIETTRANYATQAELSIIQRLQAEFARELAELEPRLPPIRQRIARLERKPGFSATSQLLGRSIFAVSSIAGNDIDSTTVFSHRTEINFDSSFSGKDRLRIRLLARNSTRFDEIADTDMANVGFGGDSKNEVRLSQLSYRFRPTKKLRVYLSAEGGSFTSFADSFNSPISSSSIGHVSNFADKSAIYELGGEVGVGIEYHLNKFVHLSLGYMAGNKSNRPQRGIGGDEYGAIAQLTLRPNDDLELGITYIRAYDSLDTGKGSEFANDPFDGAPATANGYGIQASYRLNDKTTLSAWVGLIDAQAQSGENKGDNAQIFTWATTLALNDVGGQGNLLGLAIGQPPKAIANDMDGRQDPDTTLHLEAFYRYRLNNNMFITPGFYLIINPEHNASNDTIYVGVIRHTFLF